MAGVVNKVEAYFDESGSHDGSAVLCVAGYLIDSDGVPAFNQEWSAVLLQKGLTHFHMKDCAHGNGEFRHLSKQDRVWVAQRLIEIIKSHVIRGIGAMMVASVYEKLMPYHHNLGGAYNYCIWHCLEGVGIWADEAGFDGSTSYFFEGGHKSQSEANRIMSLAFGEGEARKKFRYSSHSFVDKKKVPGVQAADLLAWQMYTDWRHGMEKRPRRKDFASLIDGRKHRVQVMDAKRVLYHRSLMEQMNAWG